MAEDAKAMLTKTMDYIESTNEIVFTVTVVTDSRDAADEIYRGLHSFLIESGLATVDSVDRPTEVQH